MPHPPLENLGMVQGCGNHWRLEHQAVMGVRSDGMDGHRWMRECAMVSTDLGTKFMYHPMTGYAAYIALPLDLPGPLRLIADRAIIWLGRITHGGYSGAVIVTLHKPGQETPILIHLDQAELTGAAITAAQERLAAGELSTDGDAYTAAFHEAGTKLFEDWWGYRLSALAQLALAVRDFAVKYPVLPE